MPTSSKRAYMLAAIGMIWAGGFGCGSDEEPPTVNITSPDAFTRSVQEHVQVLAYVTEETELDEVILMVDGNVVDRKANFASQGDDCGCIIELDWNTAGEPVGAHTLRVHAVDAAGNAGDDQIEIELVDRLLVTGIMVTNEMDDGFLDNHLEVEVHLRDADTNEFVGCTGLNQGMDPVAHDDTYYSIVATLVSPKDIALELTDVQDHNLIARVIENDDPYQCPAPDGADVATLANDDDLLGVSLPFLGADLAGDVELSFDGVPTLEMHWGRAGGR